MPDWQSFQEAAARVLGGLSGEAPFATQDALLVAAALLLLVWLIVVVASRRAKLRRQARTVEHLSREHTIQALRER